MSHLQRLAQGVTQILADLVDANTAHCPDRKRTDQRVEVGGELQFVVQIQDMVGDSSIICQLQFKFNYKLVIKL